jgi:hypothetical protein
MIDPVSGPPCQDFSEAKTAVLGRFSDTKADHSLTVRVEHSVHATALCVT